MKKSCRDLSVNLAVDSFIFENNQLTLFSCFTFIPKTCVGIPKTGIIFYGERSVSAENPKKAISYIYYIDDQYT